MCSWQGKIIIAGERKERYRLQVVDYLPYPWILEADKVKNLFYR